MNKKVMYTEKAPSPGATWSQAVKSGNFVFLSGNTGLDPITRKVVEGGIKEQTNQALTNMKNVLEAANASLENVVSVTLFLRNINDLEEFNEVYGKFFNKNFPARITIEATRLPLSGILLEIGAIAVLH